MAPSLCGEASVAAGDSVALRALVALLETSGSVGCSGTRGSVLVGDDAIGHVADSIRRVGSESTQRAVKAFEEAGRRCLKELDPSTVELLRRIRADATPTAAPSRLGSESPDIEERDAEALAGISEEEVARVKLMFDYFDTEKTGLLGKREFKHALLDLGLGGQMTDTEVDALVAIADKNGDGAINLQEFTGWLYGTGGTGGDATTAEPSPKASNAETALRKELGEARKEIKALEARLQSAQAALAESEARSRKAVQAALDEAEESYDRDNEATFDFFRSVCSESAAPMLGNKVDISSAELLGNGKYGFVFKSRAVDSTRDVVLKLMSVRWAHVACKEWQQAKAVEDHPYIVRYEDALLHRDVDESLAELLRIGQDNGKLQGRSKRTKFPDRYICLIEEFMNRGTVQDWMDKETLFPGGVLVVMQRVASALAYMHGKGITHNDIKPENVLLHQNDEEDARAEVTVKLADFGLAKYSKDRSADFQQYGLTVHSMMTGTRFGSKKFRPEMAPEFVEEVSELLADLDMVEASLAGALRSLPGILKQVFSQETTMAQLEGHPHLQDWDVFEGEGCGEEEEPEDKMPVQASARSLRRMTKSLIPETVRSIGQISARFNPAEPPHFSCASDVE
mmetsp:Transcript_50729/g.146289  ORF Transcript_50729/g.146289 Transcript_50729/m.146289 type:complete len:627 (+) Transcript_50729:31-1911(+)